ncbi:MAG: Cytochrome c family protein [uncultured Sulfurovum sp.]|uniref:Cytochrome c family protein n=1 Tax=uncultured Sulfurovum sp. TaxID=269237 RepID=A0A6S6TBI4_9BACT|nr:MAG: Cytochrome c family protein [uncultured Sulfurovum sp.]
MKKTLILSSLLCLSMLHADNNVTSQISKKQEGVKYIKMLGKTLKTHLKSEMKADKTGLKAVDFCTTKADELTKEINSQLPKGVTVRRTALKTRTDKNKPDTLDSAVMESIINDMDKKNVNLAKPLMVETPSVYRVYKPLFITPACMKCHGNEKSIHPDVQKVITKNYPNDKAMNFQLGDLRGVVVAEINK